MPGVAEPDAVTVRRVFSENPAGAFTGFDVKLIVVPAGAAGWPVSRSMQPEPAVTGEGQSAFNVTGARNSPRDSTVIVVGIFSPATMKNAFASRSASFLSGGQPCAAVRAMPPPSTDCGLPVLENFTTRPLRMSATNTVLVPSVATSSGLRNWPEYEPVNPHDVTNAPVLSKRWMRLLSTSATKRLPVGSSASPRGLVNWPGAPPDGDVPGIVATQLVDVQAKPRLRWLTPSQLAPETHLPSHPSKMAPVMVPAASICRRHLWMRWFDVSEMKALPAWSITMSPGPLPIGENAASPLPRVPPQEPRRVAPSLLNFWTRRASPSRT